MTDTKTHSNVTYLVKFVTYYKGAIIILSPEGHQRPSMQVLFSSSYYSPYSQTIQMRSPPPPASISSLYFVLGKAT